jgi:hemin uptake protein HemP
LPAAAKCTERTEPAEHIVESAELLQGKDHVLIRHEGALYRLQTTRLGKLILTK